VTLNRQRVIANWREYLRAREEGDEDATDAALHCVRDLLRDCAPAEDRALRRDVPELFALLDAEGTGHCVVCMAYLDPGDEYGGYCSHCAPED